MGDDDILREIVDDLEEGLMGFYRQKYQLEFWSLGIYELAELDFFIFKGLVLEYKGPTNLLKSDRLYEMVIKQISTFLEPPIGIFDNSEKFYKNRRKDVGTQPSAPQKWPELIDQYESDAINSIERIGHTMENHGGSQKDMKNLLQPTLLEKLKAIYLNSEGLPPDRIVPTVGLNIGRIEASNAKLVFWDLGGQIGLRTIWEKYYEEAHAIIYVIDASCPSSFEDAKSALEKVLRHDDLRGAPLLILANKQDLPNAVSSEELARYLDLKELGERVYLFESVSAYDGKGIKYAIDWLVDALERSKRTELLRTRAGNAAAGSI
ncbi:hypothetical protein HPP92_011279 [Vanilla planifolia]|uniref:Uncharacterized protein n=1 Tax=Vanilla planifolia TaxID=51239 RepID=A0A835R849_VANPL|nr:hypothetical protein HPP92_011279 [Vanilla planifolia]